MSFTPVVGDTYVQVRHGYVTKIFGDNSVTTEVIHNGISAGTLHRTLPKSSQTQYRPLLRTGLTAPPVGESGVLTISDSSLTVQ